MIRRKCKKCGRKINSKYRFCPFCGNPLYKEEDWGMLGRDDFEERGSFFEGFTGNMFNKMLGSAMKMLEREMKREMSRTNAQPRTNVRLMINGKEIDLNKVENRKKTAEKKKGFQNNFSKECSKKFSKLTKKEPNTNVRRLSDKVIYEINMPGVKSLKDVSIIKLENSIEIKAVSKDKAYFKLIPINLPIIDYDLSKGTLILEFEAKN